MTGGEKALRLNEINTAIGVINDRVDTNADVIFGTVIDESLGDEVIVTVIATGID